MTAHVDFIPVTDGHIAHVAENMRADDVREVRALGKTDTHAALVDAVQRSKLSACVMIDGEPAAIMGLGICGPLLTPVGVPWMLGSTLLDRHRKLLLTEAPPMVDYMRRKCSRMENYVFTECKKSVRWLKRLGFTIHPPIAIGPEGQKFHPFTMG